MKNALFFLSLFISLNAYADGYAYTYTANACHGTVKVGLWYGSTANSWCAGPNDTRVNVNNAHTHSPPPEEITKGLKSVLSKQVLSDLFDGNIVNLASYFSQGNEDSEYAYSIVKDNIEIYYNCFSYLYGTLEQDKVRKAIFPGERMSCQVFSGESEIKISGSDDYIIVKGSKPVLVIAFINPSDNLTGVYIPAEAVRRYETCAKCAFGEDVAESQ